MCHTLTYSVRVPWRLVYPPVVSKAQLFKLNIKKGKNMNRKHLLLLTLLLSQSAPVWGMEGKEDGTSTPHRSTTRAPSFTHEVDDLHRSIQKAIRKIQRDPNYDRDATRVILVGDTGRGKTTLLHYLAGKDLEVKQVPNSTKYFLDVDPQDLLSGSDGIGQTVNAGSFFPSSWYDQQNDIVYWDCTGFRDPAGEKQEIINALAIHQLFKSPSRVKVVLVALENDAEIQPGRAAEFLGLLKRVSEILPDSTQLNPPTQGVSLVITGQRNYDPPVLLQRIANQLDSSNPPHQFRTGPVRDLIELLSSSNRSAALPEPKALGSYPVDHRSSILSSIHSVQPIDNPRVNLVVSADAKLLVKNYSQTLNDKICDLINGEGSEAIVNYCNTQINNHAGSVGTLRTTFSTMGKYLDGFKKGLLELPNIQENDLPTYLNTLFTQNIMSLPPAASLRGMIEALFFLKTIEETTQYNTGAWAQSWSTLIDKVSSLTALDTNVTNGVLKMRGTLIGTSDLNAIQQPIIQADIFAFNTIIFDEDVTYPGASLNFIAPSWKVIGDKTIDISGRAGSVGADGANPGEDGQPGGPGGNGGILYGKGSDFYQVDLLTIDTDGGRGGAGGRGAKGRDGANGRDGDLSRSTLGQRKIIHEHTRDELQRAALLATYISSGRSSSVSESKFTTLANEYHYNDQGTNGQTGGNGGRGGAGGKGGLKGSSIIDGYESGEITSSDGGLGTNGTAGTGGQGGVHGRHCQGTHVTGRKGEEAYVVPRKGSPWWVWLIPVAGQITGTVTAIENARDPADTRYKIVPVPDVWEVPLGYQSSRGSAPNGSAGTGYNTKGRQEPPAQETLDKTAILSEYRTYYQQAQQNPATADFVRNFSNL